MSRKSGWTNYRPPKTRRLAFPDHYEVRVSDPRRGSDQFELLILDLDAESGDVTLHDSVEHAVQHAEEHFGRNLDWTSERPST